MKPLAAAKWIRHFQTNRSHRPEPRWDSPVRLQPAVIQKLLPSIQQFQLGDGGGPASLIARDAEQYRISSEDTQALTDLWFQEEREHSRLLGEAVRRLGGQPIKAHWSFSAFCACRRLLGVRAELQILLLTELVSTAYYKVLRAHVDDEPLKEMCSLILRDEAGHVSHHRDRLAGDTTGKGLLWVLQFWLCGYAAATMLWVNHGRCLYPLGARQAEYYQEVRFQISRFVHSLFRPEIGSRVPVLPRSQVTPNPVQAV